MKTQPKQTEIRDFGQRSFVRTKGLIERIKEEERKMNEHLYKLKKDGKTVGYLKLAKGWTQFQSLGRNDWYYPCDFAWTSAHPFVTKDKNGKDVFTDDEIKALYRSLENFAPIMGKVGWRDETLNWVLYHTPNTPEFFELWQLHEIELIEGKEDE